MEQHVQEVLWVGIICNPSNVKHLEAALVQVLEKRGELGLLELRRYTEVPLPHLQNHFHIQADICSEAAWCRDGDGRQIIQVAAILGFRQESLGANGIKLVPAHAFIVSRKIRGQDTVGRPDRVSQYDGGNFLLVNRQVKRLAHLDVIEGRFVDVQPDVIDAERRRGSHQLWIQVVVGVIQAVEVGEPHPGDVNLVVLIHQQGRATTENEFNLLEFGGPQVEILVAGQH